VKRTIESLQAGRGLAALAVVIHHSAQASREFGQLSVRPLEFGYLGVDFFFVLSGFIIYHSTVGRNRSPREYMLARFRRVYLPYWPVGIIVAGLYLLKPTIHQWAWLPTLTLFPVDSAPALTVAWTLQHEILFYVVFGLFCFADLLPLGLAIWGIAIIVGVPHLAFEPINLEFLFGIVACLLYRSGRAYSVLILPGIALGSLFAIYPDRLLVGAMFALLIAPIAQLEAQERIRVPRFLIILGAASYSLYLVHYPLVAAAAHLGAPVLLIGILVSVAAGLAYHFGVERHVIKAKWNPEVFPFRKRPVDDQACRGNLK
jgi:exopolysaccharide production protein ExoZ